MKNLLSKLTALGVVILAISVCVGCSSSNTTVTPTALDVVRTNTLSLVSNNLSRTIVGAAGQSMTFSLPEYVAIKGGLVKSTFSVKNVDIATSSQNGGVLSIQFIKTGTTEFTMTVDSSIVNVEEDTNKDGVKDKVSYRSDRIIELYTITTTK